MPLVLVVAGLAFVAAGLFFGFGRPPGPGRPGDVQLRRGPVSFHVPFGTSLLISVILTIALNLALCAGPR